MIKASFCYVFQPAEVDEAVARLAGLGYDGIEFWQQIIETMPVPRLKSALTANGIACSQVCPYFDFVSGKEKWDATIEMGKRYIDIALELGSTLIRVFTGPRSGSGAGSIATEVQWNAAIEGLQVLCDLALPHNIRFALECHEGMLMEDSPTALRLLNGVGRSNLGANPQVPLKDEGPMYSLEQLAPFTIHMHSHNWIEYASEPHGTRMTCLEDGVLDYYAIAELLMRNGFDGYLSIEHANHGGKDDSWDTAKREASFFSKLKKHTEK